jgi:hypothetical protein
MGFKKGHPYGGYRKEDRRPLVLQAMRHVLNRSAERDRTELQSNMRLLLEQDRKSFMSRMDKLERDYQRMMAEKRGEKPDLSVFGDLPVPPPSPEVTLPVPPSAPTVDVLPDEGSQRALRLLEEELLEIKREAEQGDE